MKRVEIFSERLGGMASRKDAWKGLNKGARAGFAAETTAADPEVGGAPETLQMPNTPQVKALTLEAATTAAGAGGRPLCAGLKIDLKGVRLRRMLKNFITLYSNGCNDARHTGILTPHVPNL